MKINYRIGDTVKHKSGLQGVIIDVLRGSGNTTYYQVKFDTTALILSEDDLQTQTIFEQYGAKVEQDGDKITLTIENDEGRPIQSAFGWMRSNDLSGYLQALDYAIYIIRSRIDEDKYKKDTDYESYYYGDDENETPGKTENINGNAKRRIAI